ncbi:hypothetical protein Aoki45_35680 [Algoriphagus sp. oki45]|uniref:DUF1049 domain-containing protein n=1 Tax=Algoriphagus confluentis TaxID=1697556 RepID=A0ABQ6PTM7_9BACT|nr:hypothetical protein Aoki45_35680 [Algoriphagus sp. oki45]GMQ31292.1 hypothetical protein Aconfl_39360 [Algoriphagus confluentis]
MKKLSLYLQLALLVFFLVFLLFFIFFDTLGATFNMDPITPESMVKVFLTGLIVFLAVWGATAMHTSSQDSTIKKMQNEMNGLKAKIYDFEHPKSEEPKKTIPQKNQEDPSGTIKPRQNFTDQ